MNARISPNNLGAVCLALLGIAVSGVVMGQLTNNAELDLVAEVRITQVGKGYQFVPATTVEQGQEIFYTLRIRNPGDAPLTTLSIDQALPTNTRYVAGSATGAGADILFSTDGGNSFAKPSELYASGDERRVAAADQYTHIRWQLRYPLVPHAVVLARFRAVFM